LRKQPPKSIEKGGFLALIPAKSTEKGGHGRVRMMLEEERKKLSALSKQRAPVEQADLDEEDVIATPSANPPCRSIQTLRSFYLGY
jgi:hypothetical protein